MKIAFVVPSLINRGPIIVVKDIISELINKVDEIVIFYLDNITPEISFPCRIEKISFFTCKKQLEDFDIVHSHMLRPDIMVALINGAKFKRISTLHNFIFDVINNAHGKTIGLIVEKLWFFSLNRLDKVVCLSNEMKKYSNNNGLNETKIEVIYNGRPEFYSSLGVDAVDEALLNKLKKKFFVIGISAQLTKIKGVEQIINALPYVDNIALAIVGNGPEKINLEKLSVDLKVADRCLFLGYRKDGFRYFNFFDGYCMSSRSEGFPLALLEAASFGLPTIVSNINIFNEIFTDQEVVFFELDNIINLICNLKRLIVDRVRLSNAIKKKFVENYTSEHMANNYLRLYKAINNNG